MERLIATLQTERTQLERGCSEVERSGGHLLAILTCPSPPLHTHDGAEAGPRAPPNTTPPAGPEALPKAWVEQEKILDLL